MGLYGDLGTMPIEELLLWVETGGKSGTLEVERNKIIRRLTFRNGQIVGCSSNDPATLMGQFLLSHGSITEQVLQEALQHQEECIEKNLGEILADMQAITEQDRARFVEAKIEEAIDGLFDSQDAAFRFDRDTPADPFAVEASLEVKDVLERGLRRSEERKRTHELLEDREAVLHRSARPLPPELTADKLAHRILELVDGKRTVAEILLHSHAPDFRVDQLLASLSSAGVLEIIAAPTPSAEAPPAKVTTPVARSVHRPSGKRRYRILTRRPVQDPQELQAGIDMALKLMSSGEPGPALNLLDSISEAHPGDESLAQLVANAEKLFREKMHAGQLSPSNVPVRALSSFVLPGAPTLSAEESFLLDQVDGEKNLKTILWLAPMRDVDALKALASLLQHGLIEVHPAQVTRTASSHS